MGPENGFLAKFSTKILIFREIWLDSLIALSARIVFKISGNFDFICQKIFFAQQMQRQ